MVKGEAFYVVLGDLEDGRRNVIDVLHDKKAADDLAETLTNGTVETHYHDE